jgi:hypothetical protein
MKDFVLSYKNKRIKGTASLFITNRHKPDLVFKMGGIFTQKYTNKTVQKDESN